MNDHDVIDIGSDMDSHFYFKCDLCDEFVPSRKKLAVHLNHHACSDKSCSSCNPSSGQQHKFEASFNQIRCTMRTDKNNESKLTNEFRETSGVTGNHADDKLSLKTFPMYASKGEENCSRLPVHRGTHIFFCIECQETFKSKWALYEHDTFVCQGYSEDIIFSIEDYFPTKDQDQLPLPKEHLFKCEVCKASFNKKYNLERHIKVRHSPRVPGIPLDNVLVKESFKCPLCKSVYSSRQTIERHLNLHFHAEYFICKICKKTFYQKRYCMQHMSSHSNFKKFACKLCEKTYKTRYGLLKHVKAHHA